VATVYSTAINRVPAVSLENALQGKVIGAQINMNNGAPGGGGQVQIRGVTSLLGNFQPLFVIDGVIISNEQRGNGLSAATGSLNSAEENGLNRIADLNPNDIQSIEVLKSGAASAIYGSQATNGVVVITTKRGQNGPSRFSLNAYYGAQKIPKTIPLMNAAEKWGKPALRDALLRIAMSFEKLGRLPTRNATGHFVAIRARKPLSPLT